MPPAARKTKDQDLVHCVGPIWRAQGAKTVFVNGFPWSRVGDLNTPHKGPPCGDDCCVHTAPIAKGSATVVVEGRPAGRQGDPVAACTVVLTGSPNVICGG